MKDVEVEHVEIDLLLDAVYRRWGYDFRSYARASIERRVRKLMSEAGCASVSEMIPKVLHDMEFSTRLVRNFSISVTEMFRDPLVYRTLRQKVIPLLKTWPHFKIWHAGCSTGEEVYSMAILLKEEGVFDRATIYATDFNDDSIEIAREGIYKMDAMREATKNYQQAGGKASFSEYYHARYDAAVMDVALKKRIVFSSYNLVSDRAFGEMHLILCRNVLIYFNSELQNRVVRLFTDSLVYDGFLCLGTKEDLQFIDTSGHYAVVDRQARIYQKKDEA